MKSKLVKLALVAAIGLMLVACGSASNDVATLNDTKSAPEAPQGGGSDPAWDNETRMMAFAECLREQGHEMMDPVVDADGNVQMPEPAEGVEWDKDLKAASGACAHHLEGFTGWEKEDADASEQAEQLDQYITLATCLRERNYDLDDPTAETLDAWMGDFKTVIDFTDPAAVADYEACSGETVGEGGK